MSKKLPSPAKAIESELKAYANPASTLHRTIRKCLLELQVNQQALDQLFTDRRTERAATDAAFASKEIRTAEEALAAQRALNAKHKTLGDPTLASFSANLLTVAEQRLKSARERVASTQAATRVADAMDVMLNDWVNELITHSVQALHDDASLDKALAIASGGLILAGLTGGTSLAVASAIGSVVLLAREVKANLTKAGRTSRRDREAAREEMALKLLQIVSQLAAEWRLILGD